jgi:hypothetical protein
MLIFEMTHSPIYMLNIVSNHSTQHELETYSHSYFRAYVFKLWGYQTSTFVDEVAGEFTLGSKTNETITFKSSS